MAVTPDLEKRRVPRIPCRIRVVLADGPLCARGVTADISSLGAYVRMENPWPKGTVVTFTIKAGFDRDIALKSEVVHVREKDGIGIQFLQDQHEAIRELEAFLKELT